MDTFHFIVLTVAVVLLIITLIFVSYLMTKGTSQSDYPPLANSCPDFWDSQYDSASKHNVCLVPVDSDNKGLFTPAKATHAPITAGFNADNGFIDFQDPAWGASGKSTICAQKQWANTYAISWDGVSNYTGCKN